MLTGREKNNNTRNTVHSESIQTPWLVPKPLLHCLDCVLRVVVLLEGEPSPHQSEVLIALQNVFIKDLSVLRFVHLSLVPDKSTCPCCWKTFPQHGAATTMLHHRDGARFPPDVKFGIQAKEFNLGVIRPENLVSHGLRVFRCPLKNSKRAVMCLLQRSGFCLATLPQRPNWWSAAERGVILEYSPISTEELWSSVRVTIGLLVTSLIKALHPRLLSLAGRPALGRI